MIKALILDLYNVIIFQKPNAETYSPVNFNFNEALELNTSLLELLNSNASNSKKIIFTNMEKVSLDFEMQSFLKEYDIEIVEAQKLGLDKTNAFSYEYVVKNILGVRFDEALFIDDQSANINAAKSLGIHTILFNSEIDRDKANKEVESKLKTLDFS